MSAGRLTRALTEGLVRLPDAGRIAVLRPPVGMDLAALPASRVDVVTGFRPDHDAWAAREVAVARAPSPPYAAAIVCLPRARALAEALVAQGAALAPDGPLILDGQKADGVEALLRAAAGRAPLGPPLSKGHGKLAVIDAPGAAFADWARAPGRTPSGFVTAPGLFSADGPDPASAALGDALPTTLTGRVADLGAGWGYLSARALAASPGIAEMHLIEAEHDALEAARANVTDPRARFHWADARAFAPDLPFDAIIMNPPFHQGRAPDPTLGRAFIAAAARMLARGGALWLVANRHLPYERALAETFDAVDRLDGPPQVKLIRARAPRREEGTRR